jgi:NADH-quinone oxidoreductase subunit L
MLDSIALVPALPLAGFLFNLAFGSRLPRGVVGTIACGTVGAAFALSVALFFRLLALPPAERALTDVVWSWIAAGTFAVDVAFYLDPLSSLMALVVTGVGFLIHVYSTGYMGHDEGYKRYFLYLNLFTFSMLTLVLGSNFLVMFVGWEGVGLCSYLLIGFWYEKQSATDAGKKAFIVNRIGDFGFLLGMLLLFWSVGSLDYVTVFERAPQLLPAGGAIVTAICLLFFLGATGKSAQIPLYTWLPDAMEGPTPVSALIHAATMVTAGVYMVARCHVLYEMAPTALAVVAAIGAATAIFAASIGLVQTDIKRVLAYSTVSQLGYMFLALGVGAFSAGIFHLMTHAFFKALLFLGAGSVIHALSGEQEMPRMGGLRRHLPVTHATMLVACVAIAGIPPLAGFFSKDEILFETFAGGHMILWVLGTITAAMTAFYMFRLLFLTFYGNERLTEHARHHLHESPPSMTVPLGVLAVLSVVGGWVGIPMIPGMNRIQDWLAPSLASPEAAQAAGAAHGAAEAAHGAATAAGHGAAAGAGAHHDPALELGLMAVSVGVALLGILLAWLLYVRNPALPRALGERARGLHRTLLRKWYVDEIYDALVVRPFMALSNFLWRVWDVLIIDGLVNAVGSVVAGTGAVLRLFQSGYVGTYAFFLVLGILVLLAGAVAAAR